MSLRPQNHATPFMSQPESMLQVINIMCGDQFELLSTCFHGTLMKVMGCIIDQEALACTHFGDLTVVMWDKMWGKGSTAPWLLPEPARGIWEWLEWYVRAQWAISECPRTLLERSCATLIKAAAPESGNWTEIKEKQFTYAHIAPLTLVNKIAFG